MVMQEEVIFRWIPAAWAHYTPAQRVVRPSVCPFVHLWTESCPLCIFSNICWIHLIHYSCQPAIPGCAVLLYTNHLHYIGHGTIVVLLISLCMSVICPSMCSFSVWFRYPPMWDPDYSKKPMSISIIMAADALAPVIVKTSAAFLLTM